MKDFYPKIFLKKNKSTSVFLVEQHGKKVLTKRYNNDLPSEKDKLNFYKEYFTLKRLAQSEDFKYYGLRKAVDKFDIDGNLAYSLEYIEGESLKDLVAQGTKFTENEIILLAISLTETLKFIHEQDILHRDLRLETIIIEKSTNKVYLIGFNSATKKQITPEETEAHTNNLNYFYCSPESSGRLNRLIDERSDLYSLGLILYELISNKKPITGDDFMQVIYNQINTVPPPLAEIVPNCNPNLSAIVEKLIRKNPEDRYQTDYGLIYDLKKSLESQEVNSFPLGSEDVLTNFQFNNKLYGRENEITFVENKIREISQKEFQIIFIEAQKGFGKTTFGNQIKTNASKCKAIYISVNPENDDFKTDEFYLLNQIFKKFTKFILELGNVELKKWNDLITQSLTDNELSFMALLSPDFKDFLVKNGNYIKTDGITFNTNNEETEKVYLILLKLLKTISSGQNPIVIFMDDLHLANYSTINFISLLLTEVNLKNILIVATYNGVGLPEVHPLYTIVDNTFQRNNNINYLNLSALDISQIEEILKDGMKIDRHPFLSKIAQIIWDKTTGIPLYVNHYINVLVNSHLINYSSEVREWTFDIDGAKELEFDISTDSTFNININKLSPVHKDVMFLAACIGTKFTIDTLQRIGPWDLQHLESILESFTHQHLIFALSDGRYVFIHERIRKAAYNLKKDIDRAKVHKTLGRTYNDSNELLPKVYHFNRVIENDSTSSLINEELLKLNIKASEILFDTTAYSQAYEYLDKALQLEKTLSPIADNLTLRLRNLEVKINYELKKYEYSYANCKLVIENQVSNSDKKNAVEYLLLNSSVLNNQQETIDYILDLLRKENFNIPNNGSKLSLFKIAFKLRIKTLFTGDSNLVSMKPMSDPDYDYIVFLLNNITGFIYFHRTKLYPLIILNLLWFSLKYGLHKGSAYSLSVISLYTSEVLKNKKKAVKYSALSRNWLKKIDNLGIVAKYNTVYLSGVAPLEINYHQIEDQYNDSYKLSWNRKDKTFTTLNYVLRTVVRVFITKKISSFKKDKEAGLQILQHDYHEPSKAILDILEQVYLILTDEKIYDQLKEAIPFNKNEENTKKLVSGIHNHPVFYWFSKVFTSLILRKDSNCIELSYLLDDYTKTNTYGYLTLKNQHNYYKVILFLRDLQREIGLLNRKEYKKHTKKLLKDLKKLRPLGSGNYNYQLYVAEATLAASNNDFYKAITLLKEAHEEASLIGYPIEEILIEEELTHLYLHQKNRELALYHLKQTIRKYHNWGATNKVRLLKEQFSELLASDKEQNFTTSELSPYNHIDFISVIKSIQIISGETEINALVEKILNLSIQNSGAEKGILFLTLNKKWKYFASIDLSKGQTDFHLLNQDVEEVENKYPVTTLNTIRNNQKAFFFGEGCDSSFKEIDNYYKTHNPYSVLCIPLILQNELRGVLYIENKTVKNLFTEERINVLQMIGTQAIISLQNALLVDDLKKEHDKRIMAQKERFNLEKQLFQSKKMETLGTLAGGISHDFRNLLNPIQGFAELAIENIKSGNSEEAFDDIKRVLKGTKRATELVSQIATISRKTETEHHLFNLTKLVDETIPFVRATIPKNIKIKTTTIGEQPIHINGSSTQIQQVLLNIFTNAYHAIDKPNGVINFEFENINDFSKYGHIHGLQKDKNWVKIEIADNGKGMNEDVKNKIFDPFFTTKKVGKGTGLGLAVTHGIIVTHKGIIHVDSEINNGTSFSIFLPVSKVKSDEKEKKQQVSVNGQGKVAVLIDDEDMSLLLLQKMFEKLNFETKAFESSNEALKWISENSNSIHIIVTDQNMPEITGVQLAQKLKELNNETPIILNTGDTNYSKNKKLPKNIKSTISKPITFAQLNDKVGVCLDKK